MLRARIREHGEQAVYEVFDKASKSLFLNGNGSRGFIASIDWLLKPTNFLKTLEGNYDNNRSNGTNTTNQRYHQTTTDGHPSDSELRQQSIRIMQRLEREGADSEKQVWGEGTVPF